MIELVGRLLLGMALHRANRTELGSRTMPYKLILIPVGLIVASFVYLRIVA